MDNRVRIMHVIPIVRAGGVEMRRAILASRLDPDRFWQKVVCFRAGGPLLETFNRHDVEVIQTGGDRVWHLAAHRRLRAEIADWKPHILHGAVFEGEVLACISGRSLGVPVVIREETSDCSDRGKRSLTMRWVMRALTRRADAVIGVSERVGEYLTRTEKVPKSKLRVIWNAARDFGRADPIAIANERDKLAIPPGSIVIGSVGRMENHVKRYSDLIDAIRLIDDIPDLYLLLVGDGEDLDMLKSYARQLGVESRIIFAGHRFDHQLFLSIMDIFALVSCQEAFGLALAEAMFSELPAIVTRVGALPAVVEEGVSGFVVPPCDPPAIANAIRALAHDPERRAAMGKTGRVRALERYGVQRYVQDVESLYLELLTMKGINV